MVCLQQLWDTSCWLMPLVTMAKGTANGAKKSLNGLNAHVMILLAIIVAKLLSAESAIARSEGGS